MQIVILQIFPAHHLEHVNPIALLVYHNRRMNAVIHVLLVEVVKQIDVVLHQVVLHLQHVLICVLRRSFVQNFKLLIGLQIKQHLHSLDFVGWHSLRRIALERTVPELLTICEESLPHFELAI